MLGTEKVIYIIKLKGLAYNWDSFRAFLKKSINRAEKPAYYNLTTSSSADDMKVFGEMQDGAEYRCAILDYVDDTITRLYWTTCTKYSKDGKDSIHCRLKYMSDSKAVIENFVYSLQLNLDKDFSENSFINYDISAPLIEQMRKFETAPFNMEAVQLMYPKLDKEDSLSPLAQKNEYCRRKYNLKAPQERGEFQRDYDRIIYSKAFRRMVDKAQIFSSTKGDHYRTRMTHTLIVCQIARSISSILNLNSTLAEAIAVGHDLGHTPFGHQGERTLHAILTGAKGFEIEHFPIKTRDDKTELFPYGGFKHNYQSVRVSTNIESQYLEIDGLDLSEQTLNGMWMHTQRKKELNIGEFSDDYLSDSYLPPDKDFAFTLEGQVVALADEIAQRSHDIDDAFASHLITLTDFAEYLELKKSSALKYEIDEISKKLNDLKSKNRLLTDENEVICFQISSIIVNYFIQDACNETKKRMGKYDVEVFKEHSHRIYEKLARFSDAGEELCRYLDNIIRKRVINSHEVALFDQNGSRIILALFKSYFKNPTLLHTGTLKRIWNEFRKQNLETIDFEEGKPEIVKDEWNQIVTADIPVDVEKRTLTQRVLLKKRIILVRGICDFISGMTDTYALNEYRKIAL